jgi:hypothetical protein
MGVLWDELEATFRASSMKAWLCRRPLKPPSSSE